MFDLAMGTASSASRLTLRIAAAMAALFALLLASAWGLMRGSLPQLDGDIRLPGLQAPLVIARDGRGTVVLSGSSRLDVARGLGFVHAQERFFEMDLARRNAAGELSALIGPATLEADLSRRHHRLRARLAQRWATLPEAERATLQGYAEGVNAGLGALAVRPWQYLLLRSEPEPWQPVDSLLTVGAMYAMLQEDSTEYGFAGSVLRDRAGDAVFDWLNPRGGQWDAALDASQLPALPIPGPDRLDLREPSGGSKRTGDAEPGGDPGSSMIGSNNWAVAGSRTADGRAILANDMHLPLGVPSIWFRAEFRIGSGPGAVHAAGVTLPGSPVLVVGTNGAVAWGFTNATGQWFDWIRITSQTSVDRLRVVKETIAVKGGEARTLEVREFDGMPILKERDGHRYALRWIAHEGEAYNVGFDEMLRARTVDEAASIAHRSGLPHQNILMADGAGNIAWTIAGRLWARRSIARHFARFQPEDAATPEWIAPERYPLIRNPADGQLWTANNRTVGGDAADLLGDGRMDTGARAGQIRDRLGATGRHDEATLDAIHFDNEARFIRTWAGRIERLVATSPRHAEVAAVLKQWNGRADADQVGFRLAHEVRSRTLDTLWNAWTAPFVGKRAEAKPGGPRAYDTRGPSFEYAAVQALDLRPAHLLPGGHASWDAFLLAQVDAVVKALTEDGKLPLQSATWGRQNTTRIRHPLSRAIPALSKWLDMPSVPQSGAPNALPHIAYRAFGQSKRMVVSPGQEGSATLSMPGGQSGHPLSPFYGAGHDAFMRREAVALLAGAARHTLAASP